MIGKIHNAIKKQHPEPKDSGCLFLSVCSVIDFISR